MTEEYKSELMHQIEEKKREKEHEKQKKMEEDLKDELRVKWELEEMRRRYEEEVGLKKKKTQMTISEEPSQSES